MNFNDEIKNIYGIVEVEVEGFFTERYINLCRINNIGVWDIVTKSNGIINFKMYANDFKKLRVINKKTKCKSKIIKKKGLYFNLFKYRKRRFVVVLIALFLIVSVISTKFIWNINITGNNKISDEQILNALRDSGIHVGKCVIGLNTRDIVKNLRANLEDATWIGIDVDGVSFNVEIVEKTTVEMEAKYQNGDVLTEKAGTITKIVAENGTPISNVGDYIEKDRIAIEGKIYTRTNEVLDVEAKGSVYVENEYVYSNTYSYKQYNKRYTGKEKYSVGVDINNKENYINYLDKSLKYDIIKNSSNINLFGNSISFCSYKFLLYDLEEYYLSREEIIDMAKKDATNFLNNDILPNCKDAVVLSEDIQITYEDEETISLDVIYKINEEVGYFKGR